MNAASGTRRLFFFLVLPFFLTAQRSPQTDPDDTQGRREEWFYHQRSPIPSGARLNAIRRVQQLDAAARQQHRAAPAQGMTPHILTMDSSNWTLIGPRPTNGGSSYVTAGRVNAIAVDPRDNNVVYIGAAEGGDRKSTRLNSSHRT